MRDGEEAGAPFLRALPRKGRLASASAPQPLPYLPGLVETWMAGTLEEKTLALYSVGWHIRQGGSLADDLKAMVFTQIGEMAAIDQVMVHQSLSFVMQSLSVVSDVYNAEMKELAVRLMQSEKLNVYRLGEEFLWFNTK